MERPHPDFRVQLNLRSENEPITTWKGYTEERKDTGMR